MIVLVSLIYNSKSTNLKVMFHMTLSSYATSSMSYIKVFNSGSPPTASLNLKDNCTSVLTESVLWLINVVLLQVTGVVTDKDGKAHYVLSGTWDEKMEFSRVIQSSKGEDDTEGKQRTVYQTLKAKEIWIKNPLP